MSVELIFFLEYHYNMFQMYYQYISVSDSNGILLCLLCVCRRQLTRSRQTLLHGFTCILVRHFNITLKSTNHKLRTVLCQVLTFITILGILLCCWYH